MEKLSTDESNVAQSQDKAGPSEKAQGEHGTVPDQAEKQLHDFLNNEDHDEGGESGESGECMD